MSSDILHGIIVILALPALLQALSFLHKHFKINSELSRKTVHVLMGLLAISFPWLFKSAVTVDLLAIVMVALLAMLRFRPLNKEWKNVLCNTERRTYGEFWFAVGVVVLFNLAHQTPLLYSIPLLILTIADTLSALVGMKYGRRKYQTLDGSKSLEGSCVFFQAAFVATLIPLMLMMNIGRAETLAIAIIVALLATLFEAIAWRGLDNLFIPLGAFAALKIHLAASPEILAVHLVVLVTIVLAFCIMICTTDSRHPAIE